MQNNNTQVFNAHLRDFKSFWIFISQKLQCFYSRKSNHLFRICHLWSATTENVYSVNTRAVYLIFENKNLEHLITPEYLYVSPRQIMSRTVVPEIFLTNGNGISTMHKFAYLRENFSHNWFPLPAVIATWINASIEKMAVSSTDFSQLADTFDYGLGT